MASQRTSPVLLAGSRKYASSNADTDSVIRSSMNSPSFQTCPPG